MSNYPEVAAQGLYESSNTPHHKLGARHTFDTTNGPAEAIYCRNNNAAALLAGWVVGQGVSGWGYCDTAIVVGVAAIDKACVLGGLAASMAASSDGGYGWVIVRGPQTNAKLDVTAVLSAGQRVFHAVSSGGISVTTVSTGPKVLGLIRPITTSAATGTTALAAQGGVIDWAWR
jgi:hypothetical protein